MIEFIMFAGTGALIGALGIPLWKRKVPPNHLYGLRVAATLNDPVVWYEANARSGLYSMVAGAVIVVTAVILLAMGVEESLSTWINTGVVLVAVLLMCIRSLRLASSLARERSAAGNPSPEEYQ